jgi:hypothetical protein
MNRAPSTQPKIPRLNVGGPKQTTATESPVLNKTSSPESENAVIGHPAQAPPSAIPPKAPVEDMHVSVTPNSESRSPKADFDTEEQDQLIVKLKINKSRTATPPTQTPAFGPISFDELVQTAASAKKPKLPKSNAIVKDEPQETRDPFLSRGPSPQVSSSSDAKIKNEDGNPVSDVRIVFQQPLSQPSNGSGWTDVIEDELMPEEPQRIEPKTEPRGGDEMDVDMYQADDAMFVPDNLEGLVGPSEIIPRQSTEVRQSKEDQDVSEQILAEAVAADRPRAHDAPREDARANVMGHFDDTSVPKNFDMNAFFGSEDVQQSSYNVQGSHKELSATPAQEPRREQPHQADEHDADASGSDDYDYDYDEEEFEFDHEEVKFDHEEEEFDDEPRGYGAGPSNSGLDVQNLWNQRQQMYADPSQVLHSPLINRHPQSPSQNMTGDGFLPFEAPSSRHIPQQPTDLYDENGYSAELRRQKEIQAKIDRLREAKKQFEISQQTPQTPGVFDSAQNQTLGSFHVSTGALTYERAPQTGYQQQASFVPSNTPSQYPIQLPMAFGQPSNLSQMQYPSHGYNMPGSASMPPGANNQMLGVFPAQGNPNMGWQNFDEQNNFEQNNDDEHDCGDEGSASDDDEPLRTRVKRHPSVVSHNSFAEDLDMEITGSRPIPKAIKPKVENPVRMPRPLPLPRSIPIAPKKPPPDGGEIDWSLPEYEVQVLPFDKKEELPAAKVSIPGLVREEIILSPDHAEQEAHLLLNLFIPGQQARETQDPEPAAAVLNFHTIANMVIEAYVQFEIGDTFGMGRGHFHSNHDQGDDEYERMRDAKDANVDEIFFAVVDRWRAGMESKKQALSHIRGAQEFCDVALDVIYYIKEHGLLKPEPPAKKGRSDKGLKRGPQKKTAKEAAEQKGKGKAKAKEEAPKQGTKRGTATKPNEVGSRKKTKTSSVQVKKTRAKPATPAVTVFRKR